MPPDWEYSPVIVTEIGEVRVLVADDHPAIRRGMVEVVTGCPGFRVVAEAGSADEALSAAEREKPHVAITDLGMPGAQGLDLIRRLRELHPQVALLVFSQHREEDTGLACLKAGASGYLNKGAAVEEIRVALRTVAEGRRYLSPALTDALVGGADLSAEPPPHHGLSERELQVLVGLARGLRVAELASSLGINPKTVHTYRARVFDKLRVRTNVDLVLYAVEHDLLPKGRASTG